MTSPITKICKHCNHEAGVGNFHSFSSTLRRDGSTTVREALNRLFFQNSGVHVALSPSDGLCNKCFQRLGTLYFSFCAFHPAKKDASGILRLLGTRTDTVTLATGNKNPGPSPAPAQVQVQVISQNLAIPPPPPPPPPPIVCVPGGVHTCACGAWNSTHPNATNTNTASKPSILPASLSVKKIARTQRGVISIFFCARKIIMTEMRRFTNSPVLKNQVEASDDTNLWPILNAELVKIAPNTLHVLQAIAGKKLSVESLDPMIGAAFCVLARSRSQLMNRFQKLIGLILCTTLANRDVYTFLNKVGLSASYRATMICAKSLKSLLDDTLMQGPDEATETELQNDESGESVHVPEPDLALTPTSTPDIPLRPKKPDEVKGHRVFRKRPRLGVDQE